MKAATEENVPELGENTMLDKCLEIVRMILRRVTQNYFIVELKPILKQPSGFNSFTSVWV
jgi:hypothetical protein